MFSNRVSVSFLATFFYMGCK